MKTLEGFRCESLGLVASLANRSSEDVLPRHSEEALGDVDVRTDGVRGVSGECKGPRTSDSSLIRISISAFDSLHFSVWD